MSHKTNNKFNLKTFTLFVLSLVMLSSSIFSMSNVFADESEEGTDAQQEVNEASGDNLEVDVNHMTPEMDNIVTIDPIESEDVEIEDVEVDMGDEDSENTDEEPQIMSRFAAPKAAPTRGFLQLNVGSDQTINVFGSATSTSTITYITGSSLHSGVLPFYGESNGRYKIMVAGVEGWIPKTGTVAYSANEVRNINHYDVVKGKFYNNIARGAMTATDNYFFIYNGPAPSYLSEGKKYFSFDGHYFYLNATTMLNDYAAGHRNNSLNKNEPFYNYYQFLSYRSKTNIPQAKIDQYIKNEKGFTSSPSNWDSMTSTQSKMYDSPKYFYDYGLKFGNNPILSIGIAANESAWGRSYLAAERNNLFGHSAYDSYPGAADRYSSVADSIHSHSIRFLNWFYFDYDEWVYNGAYLGNKASGVNVRYASDPYWGEKAAQQYYYLDQYAGNVDYNRQKLGIVATPGSLNVRKDANSSSSQLYALDAPNQAVMILGEVQGESVNGSTTWYKIASDPLLDGNRNRLKWKADGSLRESTYDFNNSYGFVHSSYIQVVNKPNNTTPPDPEPQYKRGDVNGDGKISALDYVLVKNHILGIKKLTGAQLQRADVNGDGKVSALDYVAIKNHILGIAKLD